MPLGALFYWPKPVMSGSNLAANACQLLKNEAVPERGQKA
ncbi:hypothetical protein EV128_101326 [Rhizobium azibense]|nr:hypothetical protein EV128_101326 [Rhizobium azibense]